MTESGFVRAWRHHLAVEGAGLHLADTAHPLKFYLGKTESGAARVVIRSAERPAKPALSSVVLVERYLDAAGKWNLSLTLQDPKFGEVFLRLADDLHSRSSSAANERVALDRVRTVVDEWRRLLKPRPSGALSMEELRGLVGELWLVENVFSRQRSMEAAIDGWLGPLGLPQDFWFSDDGYYEAKAIGPATSRVRISSENQLDADRLELVVMVIANANEEEPGAFNLPMQIATIAGALTAAGASVDAVTERLDRLGVVLADAFYHETWFVLARATTYDVTGDFPAIRASQLLPGMGRVRYQIDLSAVDPFRRSTIFGA